VKALHQEFEIFKERTGILPSDVYYIDHYYTHFANRCVPNIPNSECYTYVRDCIEGRRTFRLITPFSMYMLGDMEIDSNIITLSWLIQSGYHMTFDELPTILIYPDLKRDYPIQMADISLLAEPEFNDEYRIAKDKVFVHL
jgi:hypothetical protein